MAESGTERSAGAPDAIASMIAGAPVAWRPSPEQAAASRLGRLMAAQGITAYGSPSPESPIEADPFERGLHTLREMLSSTLWYLGLRG